MQVRILPFPALWKSSIRTWVSAHITAKNRCVCGSTLATKDSLHASLAHSLANCSVAGAAARPGRYNHWRNAPALVNQQQYASISLSCHTLPSGTGVTRHITAPPPALTFAPKQILHPQQQLLLCVRLRLFAFGRCNLASASSNLLFSSAQRCNSVRDEKSHFSASLVV